MPIYEYHCAPCNTDFETLVRNAQDAPRCPQCGGTNVVKKFSVPAAAQTVGAGAGARGQDLPIAANPNCANPRCGGGFCAMQG